MSSRAATGRQRVQSSERDNLNSAASPSRGLFSRPNRLVSAAAPSPTPYSAPYPSPPSANTHLARAAPPIPVEIDHSPSQSFNEYGQSEQYEPPFHQSSRTTTQTAWAGNNDISRNADPSFDPFASSFQPVPEDGAQRSRGSRPLSPLSPRARPAQISQQQGPLLSSNPTNSLLPQVSYQPPPPIQEPRSNSPRSTQSQRSNFSAGHLSQGSSGLKKKAASASAVTPVSHRPLPPPRPPRPQSARPLPIYSSHPESFSNLPPSPPPHSPANRPPLLFQPLRQSNGSTLPPYGSDTDNTSSSPEDDMRFGRTRPTFTSLQNGSVLSAPSKRQAHSPPTSYPSPPLSNARLTPLPLSLSSSPLSTSPIGSSTASLPLDNGRLYRRRRSGSFDSASVVSTVSSPTQSEFRRSPSSLRVNAPASIISSSGSSQLSIVSSPTSPTSPASPKFVYPGSRSSARPKMSADGTPVRFKLRGKRSKEAKGKSPEITVSPPPTPFSPDGLFAANYSMSPVSPPSAPLTPQTAPPSQASYSNSRPKDQRAPMQTTDARSIGSQSVSSGSSRRPSTTESLPGTSAPAPTPAPFVFPGGRSKAHPKSAPPKGPSFKTSKKHARKVSDGSANDGTQVTVERSRFMGIPLKRKKKLAVPPNTAPESRSPPARSPDPLRTSDSGSSETRQSLASSRSESPQRTSGSSRDGRHQEPDDQARRRSKVGTYPVSPFDSTLLKLDQHTNALLHRLSSTGSPSFHSYGNTPPSAVLDLGCGQGHWILEAATAWKGYGTKVVGFDMVDLTKGWWPQANTQGIADNIDFVKGNFLKQQLPFHDETFDLVRMADLTLCIPYDKWAFVLQEVSRVLTVGGRLELIDDHIFFPLGKASCLSNSDIPGPPIPRLDINIPSSPFTSNLHVDQGGDGDDDSDHGELLGLYESEEGDDGEFDDTATLNGNFRSGRRSASGEPSPASRVIPLTQQYPSPSPVSLSDRDDPWSRQATACMELERMFEHMLQADFGIDIRPSEFLLEFMKRTFKHAREVSTMHLTLAPWDATSEGNDSSSIGEEWSAPGGSDGNRQYPQSPKSLRGRLSGHFKHPSTSSPGEKSPVLGPSPGLMLWPSTLIPMQPAELETHICKAPRLLLSCRNALAEYAKADIADEDIDDEAMHEALWDYESFLLQRFDPPPEVLQVTHPDERAVAEPALLSDTASFRGSIHSVTSVNSEAQDAMWEYQSDITEHFGWTPVTAAFQTTDEQPSTPRAVTSFSRPTASQYKPAKHSSERASIASSTAPPYSRVELTHVRTFHVYEAIKMDERVFGAAL